MKIKVIDIMNKIHNEENVPKQIKYDMKTYFYDEACQDYIDYDRTYGLFSDLLDKQCGIFSCLNDEVEIIEEEKKIPEKIECVVNENGEFSINDYIFDYEQKMQIIDTVNEIIDYLDYLKSKGE